MKETVILRFSSLHRPRNRHQTLGRVVVESPPRFLIKQLSLSFINHRENGPRLSFTRWRNVAPSSCPESRVVLPAGEISPLCINMEGNCAVFLPRPAPTNTANAQHLLSLLNFPPLNPGRSWVPGRKHYVANEGKQRGKRRPWACLRAGVTA